MATRVRPAVGERREQILTASLALFAARGVNHVSTRDIARAVGISQPSLYAHFATRDAIATELCRRAFAGLRDRLAAASAAAVPPEARLRRIAAEYLAFGFEHEAMYKIAFMLEPLAPDSPAEPVIMAAGLQAFDVLLGLFGEVRGGIDAATVARAQSCWAALHGLVALLLARKHFPWAERDYLIDLHLTRLCRAAFD